MGLFEIVVLASTARVTAPMHRRPNLLRAACVALACLGVLGCVERRMVIRSNPPGALVYVDDYEIGTTPTAVDFTYYGTRRIRLVKDGYETLTVMQPVPTPWYDLPGLDFFSENLVPGQLRDHRTFDYQLTPQAVRPTEQLLEQAEGLRAQTRNSGVVQAGPTVPVIPGPAPNFPPAISGGPSPATPIPAPAAGGTIPYPLEPPGGFRPRE